VIGKRVAAVTGASRGIGRAVALELARAGYRVIALARTLPDLQSLSDEGRKGGWDILPIQLDIADEESRARAVDEIMRLTGGYGLDVLVNNAGYGMNGPMEDVSPDALRRLMEVNLIGLLAFTQPFLPGMRTRRRGRIVNISSAAGRVATPFTGGYNASKFALEAVSDAMRLELRPFGVSVILIEPGPIPTHFGRSIDQTPAEGSAYERFYRRYRNVHGRAGLFSRSAETVARVVLRAVQSDHPRARYTITLAAKAATLERFAPTRIRDWAMSLVFGLRKKR
jgi:NAD(P)-dependent dehydrogenase (short-subunit alcohol dehydrogenase family)